MYDDILLPTDGSKGTTETVEHAIGIARDNDATVHVLYVVDSRRYRAAEAETKAEIVKSLEVEGERSVEDLQVDLEDEGLVVETELRDGIPHREIVEYVDEAGIDLVVMGTHGRTGRDRVQNLGSVTDRVLEDVHTPVLVVDIGD
ncbi:universal stress protein [Halosimplex litoreum]|uniref:Universal stress protein n=1 Tax=Halosimplex litoreum TaxID=1198301 RepID=A0A7T3FYM3_9EURY|nr:universal stress protein [Halosimplex litoreum]QPV63115.1 universal stress protein [Halosimplex litoreum]